MTNKIVILDDSVLLYEHYINDDQWERTLAFPRGGLTYLISNGTIKFYAYEDYFYRNCLISMQLPIYIVDEYMHIDGEYDDLEEITDILDRIFPTNDIDAQLDKYLKKVDADLLYQPIGDYALKSDIPDVSEFVTTDELVDALEDYYTKDEADARFQPIGDYLTSADTYSKEEIDDKLDDKLDASAYTPCDLSNYYTKQETSSKTQIDTALNSKQDTLIAGSNISIVGNTISAYGGGGTVDAYTKEESDARYQLKGNYVTETSLENTLNYYATKQWVLNQNYVTSSQVNQYITNLQQQINSLQEALESCCSGSPTPTTEYRWITLTSPSDYICSGTTKYEKQQKQQSTDEGITWENVVPAEYRKGSVIETGSTDCGAAPSITDIRWVTVPNEYLCVEFNKYTKMKLQYSYDSGTTWVDSNPLQVERGTLIQSNSPDCGYEGCDHAAIVYIKGNSEPQYPNTDLNYSYTQGCLSTYTTKQGWWYTNSSAITSVTLNDCVLSIGGDAFTSIEGSNYNYTQLTYVDLPATVTEIGWYAFHTYWADVCKLKTVIIRATTPPTLSPYEERSMPNGYTFSTQGGLKIYVPDESVNTYKNETRWAKYASRIHPISELNS